ncbi:MAG: hypothetical protein HYR63_29570 [Proteobacteria bacterium]|nr:hypothetical protein [Pseudomonadota bacterium]
MNRRLFAGIEPTVEEMLGDPVIRAVMERDGVTVEALLRTMQTLRRSRSFERSRPIGCIWSDD